MAKALHAQVSGTTENTRSSAPGFLEVDQSVGSVYRNFQFLQVNRSEGAHVRLGSLGLPSLDIPSDCGQESRKTLKFLQVYNWPANIHELQNVIKRAVILCDGEMLSASAGGRMI